MKAKLFQDKDIYSGFLPFLSKSSGFLDSALSNNQRIILLKNPAFLLLILVLCFSGLKAQRHPHHSLAMGISNGAAVVTHEELNTAFWKLDLNHQRNFLPWFSLRTSLTASYILPVKLRNRYASPAEIQPRFPEARVHEYHHYQISLNLMPCVYYRDEKFSLFMGLAGGLGSFIKTSNSYDEMWYYDAQETRVENRARHSRRYLHLGYSPTAGIAFNLGNDVSGGEIEIALSYDKWQGRDGFDYGTGFTSFGLQTSYRYNFEK